MSVFEDIPINSDKDIAYEGNTLFENKLAQIILKILLLHVVIFNESTISIDSCFDTRSALPTCPNQIIIINFGHSLCYGGLERFYGLIGVGGGC